MVIKNIAVGITGFIKKWIIMEKSTFNKGTVYLSGRNDSSDKFYTEDIFKWKKILEKKGFKVITSHLLFQKIDTQKFTLTDFMRIRIRALLMCEKVYTLPDWNEIKEVEIEINVCRHANIEIRTVLNIEA